MQTQAPKVDSVHTDLPVCKLYRSKDRLDQRRLAGTSPANDTYPLARLRIKRNALEHEREIGPVSKLDILKRHAAFARPLVSRRVSRLVRWRLLWKLAVVLEPLDSIHVLLQGGSPRDDLDED
jgi:hypothetical protein